MSTVWTSQDFLLPVVPAATLGTYALDWPDLASRFHLCLPAYGAGLAKDIQQKCPVVDCTSWIEKTSVESDEADSLQFYLPRGRRKPNCGRFQLHVIGFRRCLPASLLSVGDEPRHVLISTAANADYGALLWIIFEASASPSFM